MSVQHNLIAVLVANVFQNLFMADKLNLKHASMTFVNQYKLIYVHCTIVHTRRRNLKNYDKKNVYPEFINE